jgi:DUF971 family protein
MRPLEIIRNQEKGIQIRWSDGNVQLLDSHQLRGNCPCATCKEKRGDTSHATPISTTGKKPALLKVLTHSAAEEESLEAIWPIGNYALGIRWLDGHDSGIYTFSYLRQLGSLAQRAP